MFLKVETFEYLRKKNLSAFSFAVFIANRKLALCFLIVIIGMSHFKHNNMHFLFRKGGTRFPIVRGMLVIARGMLSYFVGSCHVFFVFGNQGSRKLLYIYIFFSVVFFETVKA